jgi:hypothetical protein
MSCAIAAASFGFGAVVVVVATDVVVVDDPD